MRKKKEEANFRVYLFIYFLLFSPFAVECCFWRFHPFSATDQSTAIKTKNATKDVKAKQRN